MNIQHLFKKHAIKPDECLYDIPEYKDCPAEIKQAVEALISKIDTQNLEHAENFAVEPIQQNKLAIEALNDFMIKMSCDLLLPVADTIDLLRAYFKNFSNSYEKLKSMDTDKPWDQIAQYDPAQEKAEEIQEEKLTKQSGESYMRLRSVTLTARKQAQRELPKMPGAMETLHNLTESVEKNAQSLLVHIVAINEIAQRYGTTPPQNFRIALKSALATLHETMHESAKSQQSADKVSKNLANINEFVVMAAKKDSFMNNLLS